MNVDQWNRCVLRPVWFVGILLAVFSFAPLAEAEEEEGGLLCPQLGQSYCSLCDGGVTELTMAFTDNDSPLITVEQENGDIVLNAVPDPFKPFSFSGSHADGTFGKEIYIWENGRLAQTIRTDCSEAIFTGTTFGEYWLLVGKSLDGGSLCPAYPHADCVECVDGVRNLTLVYRGERTVPVMMWEKDAEGEPIFAGLVMPEEVFTINGKGDGGLLGKEIVINVNGVLSTFHTSCSEPIGPGMVSGDFEIVSGESGKLASEPDDDDEDNTDGGDEDNTDGDDEDNDDGECGECDGKVTDLSLEYQGDFAVRLRVEQKKGGVIFDKNVAPGDVVSFSGTEKEKTMGTEIKLYVDNSLHTAIHTSCSKPVDVGLVFGMFKVVAGKSLKGGRLCGSTDTGDGDDDNPDDGDDDPDPEEECGECDGKVTELSLSYSGGSSAFVTVEQKKGGVIFNGEVFPGEPFTFNGTEKEGTMGTEIYVYLNEEHHVAIHTSCSKPIDAGLVFGDFKVESGRSLHGGPFCPPPYVDECPNDPTKDKKGPCDDCSATEWDLADSDRDGVLNCNDKCPEDPGKSAPWVADCGEDDSDVDNDCMPAGRDWDDSDPTVFDEEPQCADAMVGLRCTDGVCQGIHGCREDGQCGDPDECNPGTAANGCNEPCVYRHFRDTWYWFCPCQKTREQAAAICHQSPSRTLIEVNDAKENAFLACNVASLFGSEAWLGGNDLKKEGHWYWPGYKNDSRYRFWTGDEDGRMHYRFVSWMQGEPSGDEDENCAAMTGDGMGEWSDADCERSLPFICEETSKRIPPPYLPERPFPIIPEEEECVDAGVVGFTVEDMGVWDKDGEEADKANLCDADQNADPPVCYPDDSEETGWSKDCEKNCGGIATPPDRNDFETTKKGTECVEEGDTIPDDVFCRVQVKPFLVDSQRPSAYADADYDKLPLCTSHSDCSDLAPGDLQHRCGWMSKCSAINNRSYRPELRPEDPGYQPRLIECTDAACYDCQNLAEGDDYCSDLVGPESKCEMVQYGMCSHCNQDSDPTHCACLNPEDCEKYGEESVCTRSPMEMPLFINGETAGAIEIGKPIGICGAITEQCPLWRDEYPAGFDPDERVCVTYNLCEDPETDTGPAELLTEETLQPSELNEKKVFGKPDEPDNMESYPEKEWVVFQTEPRGTDHPWCKYKVENSVQPRDTDKAGLKEGQADKPGSEDKKAVSFYFHPTLDLDYDLGEGPLGIVEPSLMARAGVEAGVELYKLMKVISTDPDDPIEIVNVMFSLKVGLKTDDPDEEDFGEFIGKDEFCGLDTTDSKIEIFGIDFLPDDLRLQYPNQKDQDKCLETYKQLKEAARKLKKAYMDAQALMEFFETGDVETLLENLPTEYLGEFGEPLEELLALLPEELRDDVRTYVNTLTTFQGDIQILVEAAKNGNIDQFLGDLPDDPENIAQYFDSLRAPLMQLSTAIQSISGLESFSQGLDNVLNELGPVQEKISDVKGYLKDVQDLARDVQNEIDGAEKDLKEAKKTLANAEKELGNEIEGLENSIAAATGKYKGFIKGVLDGMGGLKELPAGFLNEKLASIAPEGFPESLCESAAEETPADTVNRFIEYYNVNMKQMLDKKLTQLLEKIPTIPGDDVKLGTSWGKNEEITLFTTTFMIGPIPCNLEVLFTMAYGVNINFEPSLALGPMIGTFFNLNDDQGEPFAYARFNAMPYAGAGVGLFVGVGFDIGIAAAKAGIEGSVNLATLGLNLYGGAGVSLTTSRDTRADSKLPPYLENYVAEPQAEMVSPLRYNFRLKYDYGMYLKIDDMLKAAIKVKLKLKFLFFSKTWKKTLASWDGLCPANKKDKRADWCDVPLFSGGGDVNLASFNAGTGDPDWGIMQMPMPFLQLEYLDSPCRELGPVANPGMPIEEAFVPLAQDRKGGKPGDDDNPVTVDSDTANQAAYQLLLGQMEEPFYDNLCTCIESKDSYVEKGVPEKDIPRCASDEQCCEGLVCLIVAEPEDEDDDNGPVVRKLTLNDVGATETSTGPPTGFCVVKQPDII